MAVEPHAEAGVPAERAVRTIGVDVVHDPQIEFSIAIQIGERAARAPSRIADARGRGDVGEGAVAVVVVEHVRSVVGDVQVRPAVAVVIARARAHAVPVMLNPRALRDVFERAVAAVVVQPMTRAPVNSRIRDRPAVDEEHVHPPVTVVVEEHRTRPHGLDEMFLGACAVGMVKRDARLARDVD